MIEGIRVSHSDISAFLRCRRRFGWGYQDDFREPDKLWGSLACGFRVHDAISTYLKLGDDPRVVHQRLAERDERVLLEEVAPTWALDEFYSDVIVGRNACAAYVEWLEKEGPYDGWTVESEVTLETPILGGRAVLIGKADLVLTRVSDGWIVVDDLKTASVHTRTSLPVQLQRSYQHVVYAMLAKAVRKQEIADAMYTVLYKVKVPARAIHPMVERLPVYGLRSGLPRRSILVEQIVSDMLDLMEKRDAMGHFVSYPTPGDYCRWCPFRHPCTLVDENPAAARAMMDAEFIRGGRHRRYDD